MKRFVLIAFLAISFSAMVSADSVMKQYYHKTGKIIYKFSGKATGTYEYYWGDFGAKKAAKMDMYVKVLGFNKKMKLTQISIKEKQYTKRACKDEVNIEDHPQYVFWKTHQSISDPREFLVAYMKENGFKKLNKQETICGLKCSIWEGKNETYWTHNAMLMKLKRRKMGVTVTMTATSYKTNVSLPANIFNIPK